jgi:hypothetical protein
MVDRQARAIMLSDLDPQAFLATEDDEIGAQVRDLMLVNAERVIWIEADAAERTLRFQIDRDGWLRVVLPTQDAYDRARARAQAAFQDGGSG